MKRVWIAVSFVLAALLAAHAWGQGNVRIRGTITAVDADTLAVKARDGRDVKIRLPADLPVTVPVAVRFEEIKPGDYLGSTTKAGPDGVPVALDIHYIAPTVPEGQTPSDQGGGAVMTNARVGAVVHSTGTREMTVEQKGVAQRIVVPPDVPIVRAIPGVRGDLVAGEAVIVVATAGADGALTALRIQVGKNGVAPI
jgi:hypothetical protein